MQQLQLQEQQDQELLDAVMQQEQPSSSETGDQSSAETMDGLDLLMNEDLLTLSPNMLALADYDPLNIFQTQV